MSYMSGMMLGLAFGKKVRGLLKGCLAKTEAAEFTLARAIPGRRRYYAKRLIGNEELAKLLETSLVKLEYVDEVKASHITGSLLIVYHGDETKLDAAASYLATRVFGMPAKEPQVGAVDNALSHEGSAETLASFGQSVRGTFNAFNRHIKMITGGWFDLPSLLSLLFTIRGLQKILVLKQLPPGPQLIWWAFSLLRGWRIA